MKVAIYTCVTEGYDKVAPPSIRTDGVDYLCFNDGSISPPDGWVDIRINNTYSGKDANRHKKILPHQDRRLDKYDFTIYIDGSIELVGDLTELIDKLITSSSEVFMYQHPRRHCIYDEARACIKTMKAPIGTVAHSIKKYRAEGVPENFGLFECSIIFRKKSNNVNELMNLWWDSYLTGVKRDQIALIYTLWKNDFTVESLGPPDFRIAHRYFRMRTGHSKDFVRRHLVWWIWRPLISMLIKSNLIRL